MQSTVNISDDAEDDITMMLLTTMLPTKMHTTLNTAMTKKTMLDDVPATASTIRKPHLLTQFTGDIADDAKVAFPMPLLMPIKPMMIPTTVNDEKTMKMKLHTPD